MLYIHCVNNTFSRHRLRLVGRTDGGLHPAFYSSPNGDIVEHRICEITRDSGYPPPRNLANPPSVRHNFSLPSIEVSLIIK